MGELEALIRKHATGVRAQIIEDLNLNFDEIVDLAVLRASTIGQDEYGDASFHKSSDELRRERFEEHADAFFYGAVSSEIGAIPPSSEARVGSVVRVLVGTGDDALEAGDLHRVAVVNRGTERSFLALAGVPVRYWDVERFEVVS